MSLGVSLENRADGGIQFGIHEHDMFAMTERLQHQVSAVFDRARDIHENVDARRACEQHRVIGRNRPAGHCGIECALQPDDDNRIAARGPKCIDGPDKLAGQTLTH